MPYILIRGNLASYSHKYPWRVLVSGLKAADIEQLTRFASGGYCDDSTIVYLQHPCVILTALEVLGYKVVASSSTSVKQDYNEYMWTMRKDFAEPEPEPPIKTEIFTDLEQENHLAKWRPIISSHPGIYIGGLISNTGRRLYPRYKQITEIKNENVERTMSEKLASMIAAENYTYVAVKGSPFASDCAVFGLSREESLALTTRFPNSGQNVVNGITIKGPPLNVINVLAQLGYKVISSTGEAEILWTLQREI